MSETPGAAEPESTTFPRVATAIAHSLPGNGTGGVPFVRRYLAGLEPEDLDAIGPASLADLILSHLDLARRRRPGEHLVRYTPGAQPQADGARHARIDIVTDDMPFLVASVTGAITRAGAGIHLIVHPTMLATRAPRTGDLTQLAVDHPASGDTVALAAITEHAALESWMHFEVDPLTPERAEALVSDIRDVLEDVALSNRDWRAMRERALDIAESLRADAPPALGDQALTAAEFLEWLTEDNFTFLGYREYDLVTVDGKDALRPVMPSGLGVLSKPTGDAPKVLERRNLDKARELQLLILTKANRVATVHRNVHLDYVGVKRLNARGEVDGEYRFIGLYAASSYTESVQWIPVIRQKVAALLERSGARESSYSGRELLAILETYPRDELFQADTDTLYRAVSGIRRLTERRRTSVFVRTDPYERYVTVMVYLPRDTYNTQVRLGIAGVLAQAYRTDAIEHETRVSESTLARLYFVVRIPPAQRLPEVDEEALTARIVQLTRNWMDDLQAELAARVEPMEAARMLADWGQGIPEAYRQEVPAARAVDDLAELAALPDSPGDPTSPDPVVAAAETGMRMAFDADRAALRLYRTEPLELAQVLPLFANLGAALVDEHPYVFERHDLPPVYLYRFGITLGEADVPVAARQAFLEVFAASWLGWNETDQLDRVAVMVGLGWRDLLVVRAYVRYLRQLGLNSSDRFVADTLIAYADLTRDLVGLFSTLHDPDREGGVEERASAGAEIADRIRDGLARVPSLEQDRLIRGLLDVVLATDRTSFFRWQDEAGEGLTRVAFKLAPARIPGVPRPVPLHEIWVYSPRVEGVHLRFGRVARGGLRWSDRREDFRTEVLGLVKAQVVKNALIVPTGAKGCFFPKRLGGLPDRGAFMVEGRASYQAFIRGLLSVTDDQRTVEGRAVAIPPERVVCHDEPDPYLVVAADKGTASFSDLANAISIEQGFWLGDAFASGGSNGYDHKAMGITARGAWVSVARHFRELGVDVQRDPFSAVAIGDMSGDVFGNGMLMSHSMSLVAAFNHRHLFLDPNPDPEASWAERRRLFELPGSSWGDYDASLISAGGGVYPRDAKSIPVSPQVAQRLGLVDGVTRLTPTEMIRAILTAPVDLLFNGGIGTYVKAHDQGHAEVGDKANDAIRVDGRDLRVRVVGEGGNLGLTQLGRVEAARGGVRLNTDAVDNSAGVDTSDHEVNIKILLGQVGDAQDAELLHGMTDAVARHVLAHNAAQNLTLGVERQNERFAPVVARFMGWLEAEGVLDRGLEGLPTDEELAQRPGQRLTSPELCVLLAYAKIVLGDRLLHSAVLDDPWFDRLLAAYFPRELVERFGDRLAEHPLAAEIKATVLASDVVDRGGIAFAYALHEEAGASLTDTALAWSVVRELFGVDAFFASLQETDGRVPAATQDALISAFRRMLGRAVRWLLAQHPGRIDPHRLVEAYLPGVSRLRDLLPDIVRGSAVPDAAERLARLLDSGMPEPLAVRGVYVLEEFSLLSVVRLHETLPERAEPVPLELAAAVVYEVHDRFSIDDLLFRVSDLPRGDRWQALSRSSLRDDLYAAGQGIARAVLTSGAVAAVGLDAPIERLGRLVVDAWAERVPLDGVRATLRGVLESEDHGMAPILVALGQLRRVPELAGSAS